MFRRLSFQIRTDSAVEIPTTKDYEAGAPWPQPAYHVVTTDRDGHRITAELVRDERTGAPIVVGLTIRRLRGIERAPAFDAPERLAWLLRRRRAEKAGDFLFAGRIRPLSHRDLQRLPLATFLEAAKGLAGAWFAAPARARATGNEQQWAEDMVEELRKVRAPRGRPKPGRSTDFYADLAASYRAFVAQGKHPTSEIAARKDVSPNQVRQWLFRARKLGLLEPYEGG